MLVTRDVETLARAIGDPGSFVAREPGESVPRWAARAFIDSGAVTDLSTLTEDDPRVAEVRALCVGSSDFLAYIRALQTVLGR